MMQTSNANALSTTAAGLPETSVTKAGFLFYPQEDVWRIADQSSRYYFDFSKLAYFFDDNFMQALKKVLYYYLTQKSASHTRNIFVRFKHFVTTVFQPNKQLSSISNVQIIDYKGKLPKHQEWFLGTLSGFFKKWHELGYLGIEPEVISLLGQLKIKGNRKGEAVRTMDPCDGPFTDIELQGLQGALNDSYAKGELDTRSYVLAWLFIALGARPIQFAALKISDFSVQRAKNDAVSYLIKVPRAKQRRMNIRDELKTRPLVSEIGEVLEAWTEQVKREYAQSISDRLLPGNLPIFPSRNSLSPIGFEHHSTGESLGSELEGVLGRLSVISERTGLPMKTNSYRFRYTLGTRAAMEGHGELIIAELLDHTDTQNVGIYVEATPEIIDRIDRSMALQLAPLAQAFSGMIITHEEEAVRGNDPASRIKGANIEVVGNCGKYGFCGALAPIVCYTCRSFQAWVDGPHEEVLENLLSERERLLLETGDYRIASVNDRTILAVAEVVQQCIKLREQSEVL